MRDYLPIAEHGVIGDLHTVALVGTDGSIDWYCCPRFDAPSVFGAILDVNKGGYFRIAPADGEYKTKQLYLPDTNILYTRFLTPDGVGELTDFMPIGPQHDLGEHRLVRCVHCVRGQMRFRVECRPRFDYARAEHELVEGDGGVLFRGAGADARAGVRPRDEHRRPRRRIRVHARGGRLDEHLAVPRRSRLRAAPLHRGRGDRGLHPHRQLLAQLDRQVALPRPLARDGAPLGADAEDADLQADRRDRRRADHQPAGDARRRAQLGLPLHLDPRRRVLALRAAAARLHRGGGRLHGLADRPLPGRGQPRRGAAPDHVRDRRPRRPRGAGAPPPRGLHGLGAGAHRQRRRRPAPARHLRRADRLDLPLQQVRRADRLRRLDVADQGGRLAGRQLGPAGRGDLGDARRPAALHLLAADELGGDRADGAHVAPARAAGRPRRVAGGARQDRPPGDGARLERGAAAPSPSTTTPRCWTPRCC